MWFYFNNLTNISEYWRSLGMHVDQFNKKNDSFTPHKTKHYYFTPYFNNIIY